MGAGEVAFGLVLLFAALPLLLGITAIAAGVTARKRIRQAGGELTGGGVALAGIICGSISLVLSVGVLTLVVIGAMSASRAQTQIRRINTGAPVAPTVPATPSPGGGR